MSDRPSFLIFVSAKNGLELFSAHHTEGDAEVMRDRLGSLGHQVHMIEVPQVDGVVKSTKPVSRHVDPPRLVSLPVPETPRPATDAEFQEQTRQMLRSNGERDGFRDDTYAGAFA